MMPQVRRFFATSSREAMRMIKEELGPHAVVLSNRTVPGGVEMLALPADAIETTLAQTASPEAGSPIR